MNSGPKMVKKKKKKKTVGNYQPRNTNAKFQVVGLEVDRSSGQVSYSQVPSVEAAGAVSSWGTLPCPCLYLPSPLWVPLVCFRSWAETRQGRAALLACGGVPRQQWWAGLFLPTRSPPYGRLRSLVARPAASSFISPTRLAAPQRGRIWRRC